jgi:hypothetical protein
METSISRYPYIPDIQKPESYSIDVPLMWVKQFHKPSPKSPFFIGGMFTIPSHGSFMALFYPH